jgi:GT2 family glycosyltransferase
VEWKGKKEVLMKVAVVTIAYSSSTCPSSVLETASTNVHEIECHLFLHSKYPNLVEACNRIAQDTSVVYYPFGMNRGVSKSWNEGILAAFSRGADVVIVANDDIRFSAGDIDKLASRALDCRDRYIISCAGFHERFNRRQPSLGYSCFAINPIAIEKLGCFDENIFPAYCEDQDYSRRAGLAGLHEENCQDTLVSHAGSNSVLSDPALGRQNALTHRRNMEYYRLKWGGNGGQETYPYPFNNPRIGLYISPRNRETPYGPTYDRRDRIIVQI